MGQGFSKTDDRIGCEVGLVAHLNAVTGLKSLPHNGRGSKLPLLCGSIFGPIGNYLVKGEPNNHHILLNPEFVGLPA